MDLKQTPLYKHCLDKGSRMISFAGWQMPLHFSGLINEHHSVRKNAGLFDISHMGVLLLEGVNPKDQLQYLVPTDLDRIGSGEACYTVLLNERGGIIDDVIIYDLGNDDDATKKSLLIIFNAGRADVVTAWLKQHLLKKDVVICDGKNNGVLLALQGPKSSEYLEPILGESIQQLPRFGHKRIKTTLNSLGEASTILVARTGYTGEDGYEILLGAKAGKTLWENLLKEGVTPCGLGARDTLRLEAAMHLYGNEINEQISPLEAGLGWLVHLEMPKQFLGRSVLENQTLKGIQQKLVGLKIHEKAIARKGYEICHEGKTIGEITSGSWSPTLEQPIALGFVPSKTSKVGTKLTVKIRDKVCSATIVKKPFYRRIT